MFRFDDIRFAAALAGLWISLAGCEREDLNAVTPVRDPSVDETPPDAPFRPGQRRDVGDADATFVQSEHNEFMRAVTMPGDLDGDGLGDLLIWGELSNEAEIVPCHAGCPGFQQVAVHVIYGSPSLGEGGVLRPDAVVRSWHINGVRFSVDAAGDVDADGFADVLVGVGTPGCEQGSAFVIHGGPRLSGVNDLRDVGALLRESGTCTHFGEVAGLGDVDGDGRGDFAIGAPRALVGEGTTGRLFLYYGSDDEPPQRRSEEHASASFVAGGVEQFGFALRAGDVDGDGRGDFLVRDGVDRAGDRAWWLVRGRGERFTGEREIESIATRIDASTVRGVGDLDGDGLDDLGVTVFEGERDGFVLWGRTEWPEVVDVLAADTWIERGDDARTGVIVRRQLLPAGDVDGDGRADVFYADPAYSPDMAQRGAAYLFGGAITRGSGGLPISSATAFLGQDWRSELMPERRTGYDSVGRSIAAGSDLDGDGIDDVVFAATQAAFGGRAYLWLGRGAE